MQIPGIDWYELRIKRNRCRNVSGTVVKLTLLTSAFMFATPAAYADCQSEMRILADDLAGVKLNSYQSQSLADKVLQARRQCWVHREQAAMDLINSARRIAGLKESSGEFDWENVPLESLEEEQ
jgi:hypothetical protein